MASIEKIVHDRIATSAALAVIVPLTSVVTGFGKNLALPYLTINLESSQPVTHTNKNRIETHVIRAQFWGTHAAGKAVEEILDSLFDNWGSDDYSQRVLMARKVNSFSFEEEENVWQTLVDISLTTQKR